jgi:branched-chain amino acid transport system ATP-binding protein
MSEALLEVTGLSSAYGHVAALSDVSLEVRRGELVALVGSNGAGKTTLLRCISGVQPVTAGTIRFNGEDITRVRAPLRVGKGIAQSPEGRMVFPELSVADNLILGGYLRPRADRDTALEQVFALFPALAEHRASLAGALSGGQQQMVAIGRALMTSPKVLLLDEPSMGLAPVVVEQIFDAIDLLCADGMTTLLVEQNASAALAFADRAYVIENGRIVLSGQGISLLNDERVRAAYLGA